MNWVTFYAPVMWTLGFWEWGADYTIVKNRHIGLDIGTNRRAVDVPALYGGRVVIVTKTETMGWVVVVDTGLPGNRRYHAYCHLSAENLPRAGSTVSRNQRVGRLAAGPKGVAYSSVDYPGTAWGGIHLHLVMSDVAHGAYTRNTGASFANPEQFIREELAGQAASTNSRPLQAPEPQIEDEEEIDMFTIVIGAAWYLCIPKSGGGFHAVARPGDVDKYQSEGNKRVPVYNFTNADAGIRGELRRVITGLPS